MAGERSDVDLFEPVVAPRGARPASPAAAPEPRPVDRTVERRSTLGLLVLVALAAVAVWRIATAGVAAVATAQEGRLAGGAYAALHLPAATPAAADLGETAARLQLTAYAWMTGAFDRHDSVVGAGRELAVLAAGTTIVALLVLAHRRGIRQDAAAFALAALIVTPPAVVELARFGTGVLGVAWTCVGLAIALGPGRGRLAGVPVVLLGILTAPLLMVPLTVAVVVATARRWAPVAAVAASFGSAVVVLQILTTVDGTGLPGSLDRPVLLLVGVGVVIAAAIPVRGVRVVASGAAAALVVAALPWAPAPTLVPVTVVAAAALLGAVASEVAVRATGAHLWIRRTGAAAVALGAVAAVVVTGLAGITTAAAPPAHLALARWITSTTPPDATIDAPLAVRADLVRDGVPAERVVDGGALVVGATGDTGTELADFGDGLTVRSRAPSDPASAAETAARVTAGQQLAANPNLVAPAEVREALAAGSVDPRALVLLAALAGRGPVRIDAVTPVEGEAASLPLHRVRVRGIGPDERAFLAAQQAPFAPLISPDATTLTWPVPSTATLLGP